MHNTKDRRVRHTTVENGDASAENLKCTVLDSLSKGVTPTVSQDGVPRAKKTPEFCIFTSAVQFSAAKIKT